MIGILPFPGVRGNRRFENGSRVARLAPFDRASWLSLSGDIRLGGRQLVEDRLQHPQVFIAHDAAERLLRLQPRRRGGSGAWQARRAGPRGGGRIGRLIRPRSRP